MAAPRPLLVLVLALLALAALVFGGLAGGGDALGLTEAWQALLGGDPGADSTFIARELRLPRVLLAAAAGMVLGTAGGLLQDTLRNPLADPTLLGVSQGAALATALGSLYPELVPALPLPWLALGGGGLAGLGVLALFGRARDPAAVVLGGAICAAALSAAVTVVLFAAAYGRASFGLGLFLRYLAGSVSHASWTVLRDLAPWLIAVPAALLCGRMLNLLQLGDDVARAAGLRPSAVRIGLLLLAVVMVCPVVATTGPVAFVALLAPHAARGLLRGADARWMLPLAGLLGAAILLAADTLGRLLFHATEIPVGVLTIGIAGPLALHALRRASPLAGPGVRARDGARDGA